MRPSYIEIFLSRGALGDGSETNGVQEGPAQSLQKSGNMITFIPFKNSKTLRLTLLIHEFVS